MGPWAWALEHVPKKVADFFDIETSDTSDVSHEALLQLFESERFLFDRTISIRSGSALEVAR